MNHKKIFNLSDIIVYSLSFMVLLAGCSKEQTTRVNTVSDSSTQTTIASDEVTVNNEFDQAIDDAMEVICNPKTAIAGAIVDTTQISSGIIEIDYYAKEADGTKSRTGSDSIHLNFVGGRIVPWGMPGASATVTFGDINNNGYEVTYLTNNTSIKFIGTATLTNLYGGKLQNLTTTDSLVEQIRANVSFTFNDQAAVIQLFTWYMNQSRTFTMPDTVLYATTRGDTTMNGSSYVDTWGTDRFSNNFYSIINTKIVQNISNPYLSYNPMSGSKNIEEITEPILSIYGVNNQGSVITSGTPYGFAITWVNNGAQGNVVVPYYY